MSSDPAPSSARKRHRTCADVLLRLSQERHRRDVLRALQANRRLQSRMRQVPRPLWFACAANACSDACSPLFRAVLPRVTAIT